MTPGIIHLQLNHLCTRAGSTPARRTVVSKTKTTTRSTTMASTSRFSVPSSLPELEREPYHLLPYPENFHDADEVARGESFLELVRLIEQGNHVLAGASMQLFVAEDENDADEPWLNRDRMQAFYTLVRYVDCVMLLFTCRGLTNNNAAANVPPFLLPRGQISLLASAKVSPT